MMENILYEQLVRIERIIVSYINTILSDEQKKDFIEYLNSLNVSTEDPNTPTK